MSGKNVEQSTVTIELGKGSGGLETARSLAQGNPPTNAAILESLDTAHQTVGVQKGTLDPQGRQLAADTERVIQATRNLITEKNSDEKFQEMLVHGKEGVKAGVQGASTGTSGNQANLAAQDAVTVARECATLLVQHPDLRSLLLDQIQLLQNLFWNRMKSSSGTPYNFPVSEQMPAMNYGTSGMNNMGVRSDLSSQQTSTLGTTGTGSGPYYSYDTGFTDKPVSSTSYVTGGTINTYDGQPISSTGMSSTKAMGSTGMSSTGISSSQQQPLMGSSGMSSYGTTTMGSANQPFGQTDSFNNIYLTPEEKRELIASWRTLFSRLGEKPNYRNAVEGLFSLIQRLYNIKDDISSSASSSSGFGSTSGGFASSSSSMPQTTQTTTQTTTRLVADPDIMRKDSPIVTTTNVPSGSSNIPSSTVASSGSSSTLPSTNITSTGSGNNNYGVPTHDVSNLSKEQNLSKASYHGSNTYDSAREIIERFTAPRTLDNLIQMVREFANYIRSHPVLRQYFTDMSNFWTNMMNNPKLLEQDQYTQQLDNLIDRTLYWMNVPYFRNQSRAIAYEMRDLFNCITNDETVSDLTGSFNKLFRDLTLDSNGNPSLSQFTNSLQQLKTIIAPILIEQFNYIPITRVYGTTPKYDFELSNIVLSAVDLVPDRFMFDLRSKANVGLTAASGGDELKSKLKLKISNITCHMQNVHFYYLRKRMPRLEDEGIADFHISEPGAKISIVWEIFTKTNKPLSFRFSKANCRIYNTKINIVRAKHNILDKVVSKLFMGRMKAKIESAIADGLSSIGGSLADRMNRAIRGQQQPRTSISSDMASSTGASNVNANVVTPTSATYTPTTKATTSGLSSSSSTMPSTTTTTVHHGDIGDSSSYRTSSSLPSTSTSGVSSISSTTPGNKLVTETTTPSGVYSIPPTKTVTASEPLIPGQKVTQTTETKVFDTQGYVAPGETYPKKA